MTDAELFGRVSTGPQKAALDSLTSSPLIEAFSTTTSMKSLLAEMTPLKALVAEMTPLKEMVAETSSMAVLAHQALGAEISSMASFAHGVSISASYASSVMQDVTKQLSSVVSTMKLGLGQHSSTLQSVVRAYQPDLSAPYFAELSSAPSFEVPNVWKEFGQELQHGTVAQLRAWREAAVVLRARQREIFLRVIRFRRRAAAWLAVAHPAARTPGDDNLREAFLRALGAKRAEIVYGRARLARRQVGCMPPGRLVAVRPHLTRGPNPCRSIRTHRPAGPVPA